jgi:hypothetical protein
MTIHKTLYTPLPNHDSPQRFTLAAKVPRNEIGYAFFLLTCGCLVILSSIMLLTGYYESKYWERGYPMFFVGWILFLPGFYITRIAFLAWLKIPGYSYEDIPTYD